MGNIKMPLKSGKTAMPRKVSSPFRFLPLYNFLSALSWGFILYNVVSIFPKVGQPQFYSDTKQFVTYIQCGAVIEILNSALGIVRSPLLTTCAQVASRLLVVLGIFQCVPDTEAAKTILYVTLLTAWSITEVVRYLFYFCTLCFKNGPPVPLTFLRYNLFLVLYPLGVASELLIIHSALPLAESTYGAPYKWALIAGMLAYVPGFPVLFGHMLAQRKKVMKSLSNAGYDKTK
ncbi:hypothetical protein HG536_0F01520 [Torulaspora globosa]|uniref:Very-long-chain (3R)-3-hydroxyacyl-CoA dehydratase n=1 Tax=Torulaspora globosa TaxID=48254 RepID=A0A7G3ZJZ1_9SACH|nr:uncharacterized protein HG536_0F01520 [Torulaspora globosa]QLL33827.1 hypothetical protein HG536_0F01520 [Torulaspora globosa]